MKNRTKAGISKPDSFLISNVLLHDEILHRQANYSFAIWRPHKAPTLQEVGAALP